MNVTINDSTQIQVIFTPLQLMDFLRSYGILPVDGLKEKEWIVGIAGIQREFGVCHATAQKLKDGILAPAVVQDAPGKKVCLDAELARQIYAKNKSR